MRKLKSIQALRGVAALAVVAYHCSQWTTVYRLTPRVFEAGAAGVDLFFLISGFIMWAAVNAREMSAASFLWRRVARVGPAYWVATLVTAALALSWPKIFQEVVLGGPWHLVLSLAFVPHPDPRGLPFPILQPGWTLSYEALFYLAFAASLMCVRRWRFTVLTATLAGVWMIGVSWPRAYTFIANMLLMQFVAGAGLAIAWRSGRLKSRTWSWAAIACGLALFALLEAFGYRPGLWRPLIWGGAAGLLLGGAVAAEAAGINRIWAWLAPVGDASYSIYLWHWPALMALERIVGMRSAAGFIAEGMGLSLLLGLAGRALIERPALGLLRKRWPLQFRSIQAGGSA